MKNQFDFVDRDYKEVPCCGHVRKIRTRGNSFNNIYSIFDNMRIALLNYELSRQKELAVTGNYTGPIEDVESRIYNQARNIAKLEKEIKVLSRESIPKNYVDDRAIKLKKEWMAKLTSYVGEIYTIGIDREFEDSDGYYDQSSSEVVNQIANEASDVIGNESSGEKIAEPYENVSFYNDEDFVSSEFPIKPTNASLEEIYNMIKDSFNRARNRRVKSHAGSIRGSNDGFVNVKDYIDNMQSVRTSIDDAFKNCVDAQKGDTNSSEDDVITIDSGPVFNFNDNPYNKIKHEVNRAIENCLTPPLNGNSSADVPDFYNGDSDKTVADPRFDYKPMSDEEIEFSRKKIGDYRPQSLGNFVPVSRIINASSGDIGEPALLRDEIVVVPERLSSSRVNVNGNTYQPSDKEKDTVYLQPSPKVDVSNNQNKLNLGELRSSFQNLNSALNAATERAIKAEQRLQQAHNNSQDMKQAYLRKLGELESKYSKVVSSLQEQIKLLNSKADVVNNVADMEERFSSCRKRDIQELENEYATVSSGFGRIR